MKTEVREKPILFSGPMVRAILDGRKTVTRRIVKPQPSSCVIGEIRFPWATFWNNGNVHTWDRQGVGGQNWNANDFPDENKFTVALARTPYENPCPYGQPGDRIWIRSNFNVRYDEQRDEAHWTSEGLWVTTHGRPMRNDGTPLRCGFKPSMHMPYWLSIERWPLLEIVSVRVERLQEIESADIRLEGFDCPVHDFASGMCVGYCKAIEEKFRETWDTLNAKRGFAWKSNPWVWRVEFKRAEPPQ